MTWDDIKAVLAAKGPLKTSQIADELDEPVQRVSVALSYQKSKGGVTRDDEGQTWTLAGDSRRALGREVAVVEDRSVRRVEAKPRKQRQEKTLHEATAERFENQVGWAQEILDEWLEAKRDSTTKVLVDNLLAAKAAQLAFQAEE